jgi:hypothetical protein
MNLTRTVAGAENTVRRIVLSRRARLWLLNHAQSGGYSLGVEILKGWMVGDEKQSEGSPGQMKAEIAESSTITAQMMRECAGMAFLQKGESLSEVQVFRIETRRPPIGELARLWEFGISPTGETIEIE